MSRYLYKFATTEEYEAAKSELDIPNVVYIEQTEVIIANGVDEVSSEVPGHVSNPVVTFADNAFTCTCPTEGAVMYYTIGTSPKEDPTKDSNLYEKPVEITETSYIKVIAMKDNNISSDIVLQYGEYVQPAVEGTKLYYTTTNDKVADIVGNWGTATVSDNQYADGSGCITFLDELTTIGANAFEYADSVAEEDRNLKTVTIPASVTSVAGNAFGYYGKAFMESIKVEDGNSTYTVSDDGKCLLGNGGTSLVVTLNDCEIPSTVTSLGTYSCYSTVWLQEDYTVKIPEGVGTILANVFNSAEIEGTLYIPDSVSNIATNSFMNAYVNKFEIAEKNTAFSTNATGCCLIKTASKQLMHLSNSEGYIPANGDVTSLGMYSCCSWDVEEAEINGCVTSISSNAFKGNESITSIVLPDSITTYGANALAYMPNLATITCNAATAPTLNKGTFTGCGTAVEGDKIFYHPAGADYSTWMLTTASYLGYLGYTEKEL